MFPQLVLLALVLGKSIANQKTKTKIKQNQPKIQKHKNPKYPSWKKAHKLIINLLTKKNKKKKNQPKKKKENP
jgi:hypothetical protein